MASPEELTPLLPDTLPEDFGEWDGEASPEASQIKPGEWEAWEAAHSLGETKSPRGQSSDRGSTAAPPAEKPRVSSSVPPAPFAVKQQELTSKPSNGANGSNSHASSRPEASRSTKEIAVTPSLPKAAAVNGKLNSPEVAKTLKHEDDRALFQVFSEKSVEVADKPKTAKK
jgi:hypothetical protein